jgi:cellulose synthase/poly-beta-1,6-N-acetylglucosamine synthase-like glycosyltransferase
VGPDRRRISGSLSNGVDSYLMGLAVIIPFRAEWSLLGGLLDSLREQEGLPDEVIFVLDGGDHADAARLANHAKERLGDRFTSRLRVLRQPWLGPAAARNLGFSASAADAVVFLEADGQYSQNYLRRVQSCLGDPAVGAVSPETRIPVLTRFGWTARYQRSRWRGIVALTRAQRRAVLGGWAFRRDVFERAGRYDERLQVGEDRDLVERVRALGLKVVVARRTSFHHPEPSSVRAMCAKAFTRARQGSAFYRVHRRGAYLAVRALSGAVLVLLLVLGAAGVVLRSVSPLAMGAVALILVFVASLGKAWCEPVVVAAARAERRVSGSRFARIIFTSERALELVATMAGAGIGSLLGTIQSVSRGPDRSP